MYYSRVTLPSERPQGGRPCGEITTGGDRPCGEITTGGETLWRDHPTGREKKKVGPCGQMTTGGDRPCGEITTGERDTLDPKRTISLYFSLLGILLYI